MRRGFTLIELLVVVAIVCILAAILFPVFARGHGHGAGGRSVCQVHLKQISLAVKQYLQDNNERLPSVETVVGWRNGLSIYLKDDAVFQCPLEKNQDAQTTDYWFNARLSGVPEAKLDVQALTVMLGDGYATTDPRVSISQIPESWLFDPKSPARRHLDGANYAFADGHVKWIRPEKITNLKTAENLYTFAPN